MGVSYDGLDNIWEFEVGLLGRSLRLVWIMGVKLF